MTKDEILNMPAGREMDVLVAKNVMAWTSIREEKYMGNRVIGGVPPNESRLSFVPLYSTDIFSAWEIVERIGGEFTLAFRGKYWFCDFGNKNAWEYSQSVTPSLSICRAALLVTSGEEKYLGVKKK